MYSKSQPQAGYINLAPLLKDIFKFSISDRAGEIFEDACPIRG
jgi:hypothetical protein